MMDGGIASLIHAFLLSFSAFKYPLINYFSDI